ncbi:hypothetical protein D9M71_436800 [compost metagenome]
MIGDQGHADTRSDLKALAVQGHGFGEQFSQGIGEAAHLLGDLAARAFQAAEQYHEFIAAQARDSVFHAHAGFQAGGNDLQYRVPHRMAEGVVDMLEVVQVKEQQRAAQIVALEQGDLLAQAVHQQGAVGQIGQWIVVGQVADLCLGILQLADIARGQEQARRFIEGQRFDRYFDGQYFPALVAAEHFSVVGATVHMQVMDQDVSLFFVGPDADLENRAPDHLFGGVAAQATEAVVDFQVAAGFPFGNGDGVGA